jgi:hypothetical protein
MDWIVGGLSSSMHLMHAGKISSETLGRRGGHQRVVCKHWTTGVAGIAFRPALKSRESFEKVTTRAHNPYQARDVNRGKEEEPEEG